MDMYDEPNSNPIEFGGPGLPSLSQSWRRCCDRLRAELGEDIFNSWFGRIELESVGGGQARLSVPTRFLKSWIDTHYLGHITTTLTAEVGPLARIAIFVRSSMRTDFVAQSKSLRGPGAGKAGRSRAGNLGAGSPSCARAIDRAVDRRSPGGIAA